MNVKKAKNLYLELNAVVPTNYHDGTLEDAMKEDIALITEAFDDYERKLQIAKSALEFYAAGKHVMRESAPNSTNVCPPYGHYARQALEALK